MKPLDAVLKKSTITREGNATVVHLVIDGAGALGAEIAIKEHVPLTEQATVARLQSVALQQTIQRLQSLQAKLAPPDAAPPAAAP